VLMRAAFSISVDTSRRASDFVHETLWLFTCSLGKARNAGEATCVMRAIPKMTWLMEYDRAAIGTESASVRSHSCELAS
jgi:hypothetical protein